MAQHSNGSSFFGRSSNMTASLERLEEESEGPESAAGAVASYMVRAGPPMSPLCPQQRRCPMRRSQGVDGCG